MSLKEGSVIEFRDKKRIVCGLCTKVEKKAIRIVNELNKEFSLPLNKVAHVTDHVLNLSKSRVELIQDLVSIINKVEDKLNSVELKDLWELLKDEPEEKYSLAGLTEIYFGSSTVTDERSAMLRALNNDSLYFDEKGEGMYMPKSEKTVEQILLQKSIEEKKARQKEDTVNWLRQIWQDSIVASSPEGSEKLVELIKEIAVLGIRSDKFNDGVQLLHEVGIIEGDPVENAISMLVKMGIFDEDQNLLLLEYNVPLHFSQILLEEISKIHLHTEEILPQRVDLRHLEAITIDDEETKDIDDAISYESLEDGFCLGIHIADAAHFVEPDTLLDREAKSRCTTIYLPEKKIEMLPPTLSEDLCSLVEGQDRLAISILIKFSSAYEITGYEVKESVINVKRKLSYKKADEIFDLDPLFLKYSKISDRLRSLRLQRGAIIFTLPELKIKVTPEKEIILGKYKNNSPSQMVVSEFMILANSLVAEYFHKNKIPCIYRYQEEPSEVLDFNVDMDPVVLMFKQRKLMKKSETGTNPSEHHGLGLKFYTQITSPIRRYSDLIIHRQLKNFLRTEKAMYTEEELREIIYFSEHSLSIANLIQRNANRYWLTKYLSAHTGSKTTALVLDVSDDRYYVQLTEFLLEIPLFKEAGKKLEIGQTVEVIITDSKIRRGFVSIRLARESEKDIPVLSVV